MALLAKSSIKEMKSHNLILRNHKIKALALKMRGLFFWEMIKVKMGARSAHQLDEKPFLLTRLRGRWQFAT